MTEEAGIEVRLVNVWDVETIADLYRAGGWWDERWDPADLTALIEGSFAFVVAVDRTTGKAVGMGRVISDGGVSDGYVQDLVVLPPGYRGHGIGTMILSALLDYCTAKGVAWVALVAEPGTEPFYTALGFRRMEGHTPMRWYPQD
ncbi:GNAT family N-acetyltransferase [Methanoculleus chikugoensis]|uniref:GNAT family N-acetyltransferase n=1 Tax=Methanoculleus chikugoensis TaxID=118126 RepID=UPI0006D2802E|nr:GNAT family N-acetyltransferase [Methanoculleus chikugoensis]